VVGLDHPLDTGVGAVYVHRLVLWEKLAGTDTYCHWCGDPLDWGSTLHIDHLDNDKDNNDPANLVPSCDKCNGSKGNADRPRRLMHA
jgi:5-methylcytosine-specific restriction endonuclease McrA